MFSDRDGNDVDPVPFLVVAAIGLLVSLSFVPAVVIRLGGSAALGIGVALVVAGVFTVAAYRRMVSGSRASIRTEVPPEDRLRTIVYGVVVAAAAMFGISVLLYLGR